MTTLGLWLSPGDECHRWKQAGVGGRCPEGDGGKRPRFLSGAGLAPAFIPAVFAAPHARLYHTLMKCGYVVEVESQRERRERLERRRRASLGPSQSR